MSIILFMLVVIGMIIGLWILVAYLCATFETLQFYVAVPINCLAYVTKTTTRGEPVRIIYNLKDMKLIEADGYPMGKFVPRWEEGEDLQRLGWIEKLLGVRFIGIPGFRRIYRKRTAWVKVEMSNGKKDAFTPKDEDVNFFAVTHLFGFILPNLELGSNAGQNTTGEATKERIPVTLYVSSQVTIENPYLFLIKVDGMTGTSNRMKEAVKGVVGNMSQDDLIGDPAEDGKVFTAIDARVKLIKEEFGAILEKITYADYELAGSDDTKKEMEKANIQLVKDKQAALGDERKRQAAQADMKEQANIAQTFIEDLMKKGLSAEQAAALSDKLLETQGLTKTSLGTYVKGASASVNVGGGSSKT